MSDRSEECVSLPEQTPAVLAASPSPAERVRPRKILPQENWQLYEASDCCEALALLRDQSVSVLLCERDHADGNGQDVLNTTTRLPGPPNLIVFSRRPMNPSARRW
jgi:DNA-binding response OmpR family regulator